MSSETFRRIAKRRHDEERLQAVASWLRSVADKIWPDRSYVQIQARIRFGELADMSFTRVPYADRGPETNGDGLRLYLRTAEYDAWRRERDAARRAEDEAAIATRPYRQPKPCPACGGYRCPAGQCLN